MASKKIDPVQSLVDFVLDIKPYHSKILEVLVEYIYTDSCLVTFSEEWEIDIKLETPQSYIVCDEGWAMYPWGLLNDDSDPFVISGDPNSGYRAYQDLSSPTTVSYWSSHEDCLPRVDQYMVYAKITEEFTFTEDSNLRFDDLILALINDNQGMADWDSDLRAKMIVGISVGDDTIYLAGNQTLNGLMGNVGREIAIHGSVVNDGTYVVYDSTFDPQTYRTAIRLTGAYFNTPPTFLSDAGVVGRAVKADSPYYWPEYGYELPVVHRVSTPLTMSVAQGVFISATPLPFQLNDIVFFQSSGVYPTLTWRDRYSSQIVDIQQSAFPANNPGLINSAQVYNATVTVNGIAHPVAITGSTAQTYDDLINEFNNQMVGFATMSFTSDDNLVITAADNATNSLISVVDGVVDPLFASMATFNSLLIARPTQIKQMNNTTGYYYVPVTANTFRLADVKDGSPRGVANIGTGSFGVFPTPPFDPLGWGLDPWGGNAGGPRIGAKIKDSWKLTVNPATDIFTLSLTGSPLPTMPVFNLDAPVYLTTTGSLPDMIYGPMNQQIPFDRNQSYYFIPLTFSPTVQTFKLAYTPGGPAINVVNQGAGDQYIGLGQHITFIDLAMTWAEGIDVTQSNEELSAQEDFIFQNKLINIISSNSITDSFVIAGNHAQIMMPGALFTIQSSLGSPNNDGPWTVAPSPPSSYNPSTNSTTVYVTAPVNQLITNGYAQLPSGSISSAPVQTTFSEIFEVSVTELFLYDTVGMYWEEDTVGMATTLAPGSLGFDGAFDAGFFDVGAFGTVIPDP